MTPSEALILLQQGVKLEYRDEVEKDFWWTLHKDQPIRLLWERKFRLKEGK